MEELPAWTAKAIGGNVRYGRMAFVLPGEDGESGGLDLRIRDGQGERQTHELDIAKGRADGVDVFPARDGSVHLVWRENSRAGDPPAPDDPVGRRGALPNQVYHSQWSGGNTSGEELLCSTSYGLWGPSRIIEDGDGRLYMAVSGQDSLGDVSRIALLRWVDGGWKPPVELDDGFSPHLIIDASGNLVMAYIREGAPMTDGPSSAAFTVNPVHVMTTADGCAIESITAVHAGDRMASGPIVAASPEGTMHMVWTQDLSGNHWPEDIWHAFEDADGAWSDPQSITGGLPGMPVIPSVVADHGGALHVAFSHHSTHSFPPQDPQTPVYARFHEGTWLIEREPLDVVHGSASVFVDEKGNLHLIVHEGDADRIYHVPPT